jgi:hypothetical protein
MAHEHEISDTLLMGPEGAQGLTGLAGPTGNTGPTGFTGPAGATGVAGTNGADGVSGDFITTLSGGTLGEEIGTAAGIQLTDTHTALFPLWMAPGNGADTIQSTIAVPTPGGCVFDLQISLDEDPGAGNAYSFVVCDQGDCATSLTCAISDAATTCTDDSHIVPFNPGDSLSGVAYNSGRTPPPSMWGGLWITFTPPAVAYKGCGSG